MQCAKLVDLLVCPRRLFLELITWYIDDGKPPVPVFLIDLLQILILWCETAACRCIYNDDNLREVKLST